MPGDQVAGEPAEVILEALQRIELQQQYDGMARVTARLEPRLGLPFTRALMRVEAELLMEDADRVGLVDDQRRTHEQRSADAFVALALRVTDTLGDPR